MRPSFMIFFHNVLLCITKVNPMPSFNSLAKPYLEVLDNMIDEEEEELEDEEDEEGKDDQEEQEEGQEEQEEGQEEQGNEDEDLYKLLLGNEFSDSDED